MQQLENELTQTQTNLETATHNLEEKEKALQNVSFCWFCLKCCLQMFAFKPTYAYKFNELGVLETSLFYSDSNSWKGSP